MSQAASRFCFRGIARRVMLYGISGKVKWKSNAGGRFRAFANAHSLRLSVAFKPHGISTSTASTPGSRARFCATSLPSLLPQESRLYRASCDLEANADVLRRTPRSCETIWYYERMPTCPRRVRPHVLVESHALAVAYLSDEVQEVVTRERELVAARLASLREQSQRIHELVDRIDGDVAETSRLLRRMDEMLGFAPQLSLDAHGELRGQRLREVAVELLRQKRGAGAEIHYRDWFELLSAAGLQVAGRDPMATFLTQIARAPGVESVRPRSGLYRLRVA
jgi:hypothetical protein